MYLTPLALLHTVPNSCLMETCLPCVCGAVHCNDLLVKPHIKRRLNPQTHLHFLLAHRYLINADPETQRIWGTTNLYYQPENNPEAETVIVASNRGRLISLFNNPNHR